MNETATERIRAATVEQTKKNYLQLFPDQLHDNLYYSNTVFEQVFFLLESH